MKSLYDVARKFPDPVKVFLRPIPRFLVDIKAWLKTRLMNSRFPLPKDIEEKMVQIWRENPIDSIAGTSSVKSRILASLIITHKLKRTVEIGVYQGGTLFPQAIAQQYIGGISIGIDPYSIDTAHQFDNKEVWDPMGLDLIVANVDWESTYQRVQDTIKRHNLSHCCRIMRMTSDQASDLIEPDVDIVHIDGNHDYANVQNDINNYVPKLRSGGFLVMDDTSLPSVAPQYERLKQSMSVFYEENDDSRKVVRWGILIKA